MKKINKTGRTGNFFRVQVYSSRKGKSKFAKIFLFLLFLALLIFFTSFFTILLYKNDTHLNEYKQLAVVPGAGITRSGEPSIALRYRLDKAYELYESELVSDIFVSGKKDEIRIMKKYLMMQYDIPESVIIVDDEGDNTYHTVKNTQNYISTNTVEGVVFISQKFHTPRIQLLVNRQDISNAEVVATDKKNVELDNYFFFLIRESLALIKTFVFNY